jgi:hypothetical protein
MTHGSAVGYHNWVNSSLNQHFHFQEIVFLPESSSLFNSLICSIIFLKSSCIKVRMFNYKSFHPILQCLVFAHKIISCWQNWSISKRFALMDVSIYTALTYLLQTTLDSSFLVPSRRKLNFRPGFQSLRESRKCHKRQLLLTSSFAGKTALLLRESSTFRVSGSNISCNRLGSSNN